MLAHGFPCYSCNFSILCKPTLSCYFQNVTHHQVCECLPHLSPHFAPKCSMKHERRKLNIDIYTFSWECSAITDLSHWVLKHVFISCYSETARNERRGHRVKIIWKQRNLYHNRHSLLLDRVETRASYKSKNHWTVQMQNSHPKNISQLKTHTGL